MVSAAIVKQKEAPSAATLGNKGYQLTILKENSVLKHYLPPFMCLSVNEVKAIATGKPALRARQKIGKFLGKVPGKVAVRSSGEVSMPGAMDTFLDVPANTEDVIQKIKEVYSSFYSAKAMAYRKSMNLKLPGTAVVIMAMVNPVYSGVSTTTTNKVGNISSHSEYVSGVGTSLVDGSQTPIVGIPEGCHERVKALANAVHKAFGPSDIEWVVGSISSGYVYDWSPTSVYLVQRRDYKPLTSTDDSIQFPLVAAPVLSLKDQIVNNVGNYAGIRFIDKYSFLCLGTGEFTPSNYTSILNAKAIFTEGAGDHSHPAIVAKTQTGIPVCNVKHLVDTSAVLKDPKLWESSGYKYLFWQGTDVRLYDSGPEVAALWNAHQGKATIKAIDRSWTDTVIHWPFMERLIRGELVTDSFCIANIVRLFYEDNFSEAKLEAYSKAVASYLVAASWGEFQHMADFAPKFFKTAHPNLIQAIMLPRGSDQMIKELKKILPTDRQGLTKFLKFMADKFRTFPMGNGYGGNKWAEVAESAVLCIDKNIAPLVGIDCAINAHHNNGNVFGKVPAFSRRGSNFLDERRDGTLNVSYLKGYTNLSPADGHLKTYGVWNE